MSPFLGRLRHGKALVAATTVLCLTLAGLVALSVGPAGSASAAAAGGQITSAGPLELVQTTTDLNCAVNYAGDAASEFYGTTACGTFLAAGGVLYGPANVPAGSAASPRTAWTPVSQDSSGSGTAQDPYRIVTVVTGGQFRVTQTDLYTVGAQSYSTRVDVFNNGPLIEDFTLYRAGDCFLQNNDVGYGSADRAAGSVACRAGNTADSRVEQWAPLTAGSHYFESGYSTVWARIGAQQPFPDTSDDTTNQDNGAGLSWTRTVFGASGVSFSHLTAFSPTGTDVSDTDGDGFPDSWERADGGVDTNNDGVADYKLSDFGATPDVPDVFVQVNWTQTKHCTLFFFCSTTYRRPSLAALRDVQAAFGAHGIRLHIDAGPNSLMNPDNNANWGSLSRVADSGLNAPDTLPGSHGDDFDWTEAYDGLRSDALTDDRRARIFHEALYVGRFNANGNSGISRGATSQTYAGRDFLIAYGAISSGHPTRLEESGTFMHELGHQLGLSHGGAPEDGTLNYKPNYPSVMNYWWQFSGVPKNDSTALLDYSEGTLNPITESSLDERAGLEPDSAASNIGTSWACPNGSKHTANGSTVSPSVSNVDWNCDGRIDATPVQTNVTNIGHNDTTDTDTLRDHDDWHNLVFDGGGTLGGAGDPTAAPATTALDSEPTSDVLASVERDHQSVTVDGLSGQTTIQTGTTAPLPVTITNHRATAVTYRLSSFAAGLTITGLPDRITLAAGATQTIPVLITAGPVTDAAFLEVDADGGDSSNTAAASTQVYVVAETVPDQPPVTAQLDHLTLTPATASVTSGGAQSYTVTAFDAAGHDLGTPTGTTLAIAPDGTCDATSCTATTIGVHTVTATAAAGGTTLTATATLTVTLPTTGSTTTPTTPPTTTPTTAPTTPSPTASTVVPTSSPTVVPTTPSTVVPTTPPTTATCGTRCSGTETTTPASTTSTKAPTSTTATTTTDPHTTSTKSARSGSTASSDKSAASAAASSSASASGVSQVGDVPVGAVDTGGGPITPVAPAFAAAFRPGRRAGTWEL